jgi:isopenicillin N synthase-like dioxygenase
VTDLVPVVDLKADDAVLRIDDACRSIGFLSIVNHGVHRATIDRMLVETSEFFALPLPEKLALLPPRPDVDRGYAPKGSEGLVYSLGVDRGPPDLFEAFNIGPDSWPPGDPVYEAERDRFFAPNIWPARPAGLRRALVAYFDAVQALAHRLTGSFASALGVDRGFFVDKTDHSTDTLRVNHYERRPGEPDPTAGQMRMGAHTDYGIVTVLYADPVPGLQIVGPDGEWHDVMPAEGALLVNLGDLLAEWTNDRWRSTLHRVVPPRPSATGGVRRRSVAFFHDGNYDALVECVPTCQSVDRPPKYRPVLAGEHLMAKLLGPRTLTASDATSTTGGRLIR